MRVKFAFAAVATAAFLAAGCGGGGGGGGSNAASGAASIAPDSAAAYVAVSSNLDSAGWTKAKALLDRFPGKATIIKSLRSSLTQQGLDWETDVKPALGDEVDLVWLDFQGGGQNIVGITKPKDAARFNALLAKSSNPPVHEVIDGWTVFASEQDELDAFDQARSDHGSLVDDSAFADAIDSLPSDSIVQAWVRGSAVQTAFDQRLQSSGAPADTTKNQIGSLDSVAAAVTPGSNGIRMAAAFKGNLDLGGGGYHAELPSSLPAGAMLYLSFNGIGDRLNKLVDAFGGSSPNFDQQRAQIELVLGYPLKDVFGLLSGEGAIALYPTATGTPVLLFAAAVGDEAKARNILDRLATLAAASGSIKIQSVQIGSVQAKEITLQNGTSAYAAVFGGKLVTTNNRSAIEQMQGVGPKLSGDSSYVQALDGSGVPTETSGFLYANLSDGLQYAFDYAESHGSSIPKVVKDNTAPLRGLLLYGSNDGGGFTLTGFLGIH
ncbi:MAG: DUF3352 domain-containing protein [Actinobacteria bacterium]|nr:DUF3352 domain-containing protein [Actinomycetota bacterium]